MSNHLEERINDEMKKTVVMSEETRKKLDVLYQNIGSKRPKKKKKAQKAVLLLVAASALLAVFTNEAVQAELQSWLGFGPSWQTSVSSNQKQVTNQITLPDGSKLGLYSAYATKQGFGFGFTLDIEDKTKLEKIEQTFIQFDIYDEKNQLIYKSHVDDTKPFIDNAAYSDTDFLTVNSASELTEDKTALRFGSYQFLTNKNKTEMPILTKGTLKIRTFNAHGGGEAEEIYTKDVGDFKFDIQQQKTYKAVVELKPTNDALFKSFTAVKTDIGILISYELNQELTISEKELNQTTISDKQDNIYHTTSYNVSEDEFTFYIPVPNEKAPEDLILNIDIDGQSTRNVPLTNKK